MSWFNQVKFFYTSTITLLATFIWAVIVAILFNINISFQLFFLIVVMSNVGRYFLRRGMNPKLCLLISIVPIALVEFLTSSEALFAVLNIGFSLLFMVKLFKEEKNDINYDEYKKVFLFGVYCIFASGAIFSFMKLSGFRSDGPIIYIGILVYIILAVISLRESMGYEYQIKRSKGSKCINYGLALFGVLLTQEAVYNRLMFIAEIIANEIGKIISLIGKIIFFIIKYPLMWLYSFFYKLISRGEVKFPDVRGNLENLTPEKLTEQSGWAGTLIINIIILIVIILFICILYKAINKVYYKANRSRFQEYTEYVEEIEVNKLKENKLFMKLKKLFRKKGTPREEVIYKYGELVGTAFKKELFKKYMTPNQLRHIIKIKVDSSKKTDDITEIFNEAKFSKHEIEESHRKSMEENVNKLNKLMK